MSAYDSNDFLFTVGGDFLVGPGGDILDLDVAVQSDSLIRAKQAIMHRLIAERGGWGLYPALCAGLERFIGSAITPELVKALERQIRYILTQDGLFEPANLNVKAIDIGAGTEAVIVTIYIKGITDKPVFVFGFDIQTGQISQVL